MDAQLARLTLLRNAPESVEEYWAILAPVPEKVLAAGVAYALRTRAFFPAPVELLTDCDTARPRTYDEALELPPGDAFTAVIRNPATGEAHSIEVYREWKYYCDDCSDTGRRSLWCGRADDAGRKPWHDVSPCGRRNEHGSHELVEPCACWHTNPALVRRRERDAKYSDGKAA